MVNYLINAEVKMYKRTFNGIIIGLFMGKLGSNSAIIGQFGQLMGNNHLWFL